MSTINEDQFNGAAAQMTEAGHIVFPDYLNYTGSYGLLKMGLDKMATFAEYDGIWLMGNEFSGMCDGECPKDLFQKKKDLNVSTAADNAWYGSY